MRPSENLYFAYLFVDLVCDLKSLVCNALLIKLLALSGGQAFETLYNLKHFLVHQALPELLEKVIFRGRTVNRASYLKKSYFIVVSLGRYASFAEQIRQASEKQCSG